MRVDYRTMETINMVSSGNMAAALKAADEQIKDLQHQLKIQKQEAHERLLSAIYIALGVGIVIGVILFLFALYAYRKGWWDAC